MAELVEGARLELVFTGNCNEGSNPSLSARIEKVHLVCAFSILIVIGGFERVCAAAHFVCFHSADEGANPGVITGCKPAERIGLSAKNCPLTMRFRNYMM